ncbi:UDP-N-acetylmuramoyl-L-alanyl-D-glutamate--2,6-diaminopimelate ligase [Engelhardtia mirabilis]|uniref:UDP-N-acetylmuramoyl-L-alanyl-D-glutamate--2, 6-diaminopimelate ligase n=1 Tax=Engelhardtia mirabilis TaxID=2528011 RepID=UPI003AF3C6B5
MNLGHLVRDFGGRAVGLDGPGPDVTDVRLDSRQVTAGDLFAALPGAAADGLSFAGQAVANGAVALLAPEDAGAHLASVPDLRGVPVWLHGEARRAVGEAAARVHGDPSAKLDVIAVTGTNGKTTVAWLATQLLRAAGRRPAFVGTVGHELSAGTLAPTRNTTPDACDLQRLLAAHLAAGGDCVALEASSHALVQDRLAGLHLDVAIFTNLTRDHLDYHGDMASYAAAKRRLFESLPEGGTAIVPATGEYAEFMARAAAERGARVITYGMGSRADLRATRLVVSPEGSTFAIAGMGIPTSSDLVTVSGRHNVENALAAFAAVLVTGASPDALRSGLRSCDPTASHDRISLSLPPGRLERVSAPGHPFRVLVDYAHTPDALRAVLTALREELDAAGEGRLICVFGCGGNRDRGKRAPMGSVVGELSDVAVLTSDNPRGETPEAIIDEVLEGLVGAQTELLVEVDRRDAIERAIGLARPCDAVLIAGKGHEDYQILPTGRIEFDDRAVAREVLG